MNNFSLKISLQSCMVIILITLSISSLYAKSEQAEMTQSAYSANTLSNDREITIRTNLVYWLGGLANVGIEWQREQSDLSLLLNGGYSPFGNTSWYNNMGGWFLAPECRYYIGERELWFVGAQLLAAGYNYKMGEIGYQGIALGGGAVGGCKIYLSENLDMDFSLGLGYGSLKYDSYYHAENGTNPRLERDVIKGMILPLQAGVSLIWKIK